VTAKAGALAAQVKREAKAAKARGQVAVVEVTASWCKPCVAIKRSLDDPLMVDAFRGVHLIRVELDDWKEAELAAAGLTVRGVPTFFAVDATGRPTGRTITSSVQTLLRLAALNRAATLFACSATSGSRRRFVRGSTIRSHFLSTQIGWRRPVTRAAS
jgi:thiol:disulfide interchange protein